MADPNTNNSFQIELSTGNLTASNVIIKPLETREGYPHGIRFANTYVVLGSPPAIPEPTYPLTISNTGISQSDPDFDPGVTTSAIIMGSQEVVNASIITVPLLSVGGGSFGGGTFGGIVNSQFFTANGTWTKPAGLSGNELLFIMMWAGGGGGFGNNSITTGGGGGGCLIGIIPVSQCNASCNVYVGLGGAGATTGGTTVRGQNTTFWTNSSASLNVCGGGGAWSSNSILQTGGGGGGMLSMGALPSGTGGVGGEPLGGTNGATGVSSIYGGAGGANASAGGPFLGGASIFGGAGGSVAAGGGGSSIYGGAGGTDSGSLTGISIFGGNGGHEGVGFVPGGGGGGFAAYSGARGEVRIWVIR